MRPIQSIAIFSLFIFGIISCSKTGDDSVLEENPPEETADTLAYPNSMRLIRVWPKGTSRIYSNGHEIKDSIYAMTFVYDAVTFFDEQFKPPSKLEVLSRDTLQLRFADYPIKFGIHPAGGVYKLHDQYPYPEEYLEDSLMVETAVDARPGKFHSVLTGYGDDKEFKIPVFAFRITHDLEGGTGLRERKSMQMSQFKESYVSTLTSRDTFAIQEYEMVFQKR